MAQLSDNLRALRPGLDRAGRSRCAGRASPWATATRSRRWPSWPTSRPSSSSCPRGTPAPRWTTSTSSTLEQHLGSAAARRPARRCAQLERELERQGYLARGDDGLRLTPRAVRRLGETALKRVFAQMDAAGARRPRRPPHRARPTSRPGSTRPWVFGDELPIDAVRGRSPTRCAAPACPRAGCSCWSRTSRWSRPSAAPTAAVALCVDLSYSMVQEGRWGPMKQTALALSHLVETRFRQDALQIIGFNLDRPAAVAGAAGRRRAASGCRAPTSSTR